MYLVNIGKNYELGEILRQIRNDKSFIVGFVNHKQITKKEQKKYIDKYGEFYYICYEEEIPVGFIGVVNNDLRLATIPTMQRQGIGRFMVTEIKNLDLKFSVKIRKGNRRSQKFFSNLNITYNLVD